MRQITGAEFEVDRVGDAVCDSVETRYRHGYDTLLYIGTERRPQHGHRFFFIGQRGDIEWFTDPFFRHCDWVRV